MSADVTPIITDAALSRVIAQRAVGLRDIARRVRAGNGFRQQPTRPFLHAVLSETGNLVEVLDAYGARSNRRWFAFRVRLATMRNFAMAGTELLHLQQAGPTYRLAPVEGDFLADTEQALRWLGHVLRCEFRQFLQEVDALELDIPPGSTVPPDFSESLPPGRLPRTRMVQGSDSDPEQMVHLATSFLELAAQGRFLETVAAADASNWRELVPDPLSEETMRRLEYRSHNLQSLYDTYVSNRETETQDADLLTMRGHVSVVFHLMQLGVILVHYYERHICMNREALFCHKHCFLGTNGFFDILLAYSLGYASRYLAAGTAVCHRILKEYAVVDSVAVALPPYRGFHVRPATLVAKIVGHYGSDVRMELDGSSYDASSPFELFRANEAISMDKREMLTRELREMGLDEPVSERKRPATAVRRVLLELAERRAITIYEHPLPIEAIDLDRNRPLSELVMKVVSLFLAQGKIDIAAEVRVVFRGDKRVLSDIRLLADCGYGEDAAGRNVELPAELAYLRHT